ncbi:MAG: hypothetical protein AAF870_04010 [Pseudomonadota bacterium]
MNVTTLPLMLAGMISFGVGAYLAATGERTIGIALMAAGLLFEVMTIRQLKVARQRDESGAP